MPLSPQITITPVDITTKNFAISAVSYTSTTATYTATGHTFSAGDIVLISDLAPEGYNGTFTITGVATNTFTVANTTNAAVTDAVGNAFWTDPTEYEYVNQDAVFLTDNYDLLDPALNTALAKAQEAIDNAATANANATAAAYAAGVAQTTANGKNTAHYSTSGPSGGGVAGDLWFQVDGGGTVLYQYAYNGSSWISAPISNTVIANLDAGKINAGTITGIAYNNGSGTFSVSPAGVLVASSATITGTIYATSGTFTGAVYASTGTIGGFTIQPTYFSGSGGFTLYSNGTIDGGNSNTLYYGYVNVGGGFPSGARLQVLGNSEFTGTVIATSSITAQGELYAAGHSTTTNTANGYVFTTGGRIARSTASSQRYKENITDIVNIAELNPRKLLDLPVRAFTYKADHLVDTDDRFGQLIPGFIAEEVDAIYPIAADYLDGPESWNDRIIVPALLALIQDQEKRIAALEGK